METQKFTFGDAADVGNDNIVVDVRYSHHVWQTQTYEEKKKKKEKRKKMK